MTRDTTLISVNPRLRRLYKRLAKDAPRRPVSWVHSVINSRTSLAADLAAADEGGVVARVISGMDCDCARYLRVRHVARPILMAEYRDMESAYDGADGSMSICFARPSRAPEHSESRNLALEAFEGGHPHVIYI